MLKKPQSRNINGSRKSPKKSWLSLAKESKKGASSQNNKFLDNNHSTPAKHRRENYGHTPALQAKAEEYRLLPSLAVTRLPPKLGSIRKWSREGGLSSLPGSNQNTLNGVHEGHVGSNTGLPSPLNQSGISTGSVGSLNSHSHPAIQGTLPLLETVNKAYPHMTVMRLHPLCPQAQCQKRPTISEDLN